MIQISGVNNWRKKTEAAKRKIRASATQYVQNSVRKVYKDAVTTSPQWSGNYAFNWSIETTTNQAGYSHRFKKVEWRSVEPKQAGDPVAVRAALQAEEDMILQIKWNSRVGLRNAAPVALLIESGQVALRPENLIPGGLGMQAYLKSKYRFLS